MTTRSDAWPLEQALPSYLTDDELRRVLRLGRTTFYAKKKRGEFVRFMADPVVNARAPYSGALVDQHRHAQFTYARSFGRRRTA